MTSGNPEWRLPKAITARLRLPLIAAPMLHVSGPELAAAACLAGVIGAFPTVNARSIEQLDNWIASILLANATAEQAVGLPVAPLCPNLVMRQVRLSEDLACLVRHRVEMVITSVGSPAGVIGPLHDVGCFVMADVATMRHAELAVAAGADGLVLLSAGSGGQTGWINPFAFVRAVRSIFAGPIILAGGIADGAALWAAQVLGCDLAYMGTKFIATTESRAEAGYREMLLSSSLDDVLLTNAFTGLSTNMLLPSILAAGLDPARLNETVTVPEAAEMWGGSAPGEGPKRWVNIWSAGHTVSGVTEIQPVADLVRQTLAEYEAAKSFTGKLLGSPEV